MDDRIHGRVHGWCIGVMTRCDFDDGVVSDTPAPAKSRYFLIAL